MMRLNALDKLRFPGNSTPDAPHEYPQAQSSLLLHPMDTIGDFGMEGAGSLETVMLDGGPRVKLTCPNTAEMLPGGTYARLVYRVNGQDWQPYQRLSIWVYPDAGTGGHISMDMVLCADGMQTRHLVYLKNRQWNRALWEFSEISRGHVDGVKIGYRITGRPQDMPPETAICFRNLRLERTDTAYYEGWGPMDGGSVQDVRAEGALWQSAAWKTLRFFREKRCGCAVPGVHPPCHADCFAVHPDGRRAFVQGGWHDLGDLSHDLHNTALSAQGLMALARSVKATDTALSMRLLEEARFGLEWMHYTRFGDGYRCVEARLSAWTDGIIGTSDDILCPAHNDPYANFCAAEASALAADTYTGEDAIFAQYCRKCAEEDFRFGYEHMHVRERRYGIKDIRPMLPLHGQALVAAATLYQLTEEKGYLDKAIRFAQVALGCQQQTPLTSDLPLVGFFREDQANGSLVTGEQDAAVLRGLALLVQLAPEHPACAAWRAALRAYAGYLQALAAQTEPYGVLSAQLCEETGAVTLRHFPRGEGARRFFINLLSAAGTAALLGDALTDVNMARLAACQVAWVLGCNPAGRSFMVGEGSGWLPLFDEFAPDAVGAIPMGLPAAATADAPAFPLTNGENWNRSTLIPSAYLALTLGYLL